MNPCPVTERDTPSTALTAPVTRPVRGLWD